MKFVTQTGIILLLLSLVTSCAKENVVAGRLKGTWELRLASGMISVTYPAGNGKTINFAGDQYEKSENGTITESGKFSVVNDQSAEESTCIVIAAGQYTRRIDFEKDLTGRKTFFQLDGDTLRLLSGCFAYDAGVYQQYQRIEH